MKLMKRMIVLGLVVMALGGCTKSSISTEAPVMEGVDPGKMDDDDDETLPRDQNFLIEEDTEPESIYDWEQIEDEAQTLFFDKDSYPLGETMTYEASEADHTIALKWIVANSISQEEAMDYAVELVKNFNDIVAVQTTDLENSSADSFGSLWEEYALTVQVGQEGNWLVDKSYKAGEKIDLVSSEAGGAEGPANEEADEENIPKKAV